jgi:hypothetical protein
MHTQGGEAAPGTDSSLHPTARAHDFRGRIAPAGASDVIVSVSRSPERVAEMAQSGARSPTVFVIDDDADVRASIADLLESAGLRAETFTSAQEFLSRERSDGPGLFGHRFHSSEHDRFRGAAAAVRCRAADSNHLHQRLRRPTNHRACDEVGCGGIPDQAVRGSGPAGCDSRGVESRSDDA